MKRACFVLSLLMLSCILSGCGSSDIPKDLPPLYPCTISITQNGEALAGATVVFQSADGGALLWFPMGVTNDSGDVAVKTNGRYEGAPLGRYKIVVTKLEQGKSKLGPQPPEGDPKYAHWLTMASNEEIPVFGLVEKQYGEAATTPHEIEITKGMNAATFDVGKPVRYVMQ